MRQLHIYFEWWKITPGVCRWPNRRPQIDPVHAPRPCHRTLMHGENHAIALLYVFQPYSDF